MSDDDGTVSASVRRFSPRLLLSELLLKQWFEPVIPFTVMVGLWLYFALTIPDYAPCRTRCRCCGCSRSSASSRSAMAFCLITGGIDLSVGAIFAVCNFSALFFLYVLELPARLVIVATLGVGAALGSINGLLIGYLKTRPFLTTLVTLIILRASVNLLNTQIRPGIRDQFGRQRRLGLPRRRQRVGYSDQCGDLVRRSLDLSYLPVAFALRLASHGDRRQPQGGAACRHPRSG